MQLKTVKNTGKTMVYLIGLSALIVGSVYVLDHGLTVNYTLTLLLGGTIGYYWWQDDQQRERTRLQTTFAVHKLNYAKANTAYPAPNRSNFTPNQHCSDPILREGDLGHKTGMLANERPYRLECWWQDGMTVITIFFSVIDIESSSPESLLALVLPVFEQEGITKAYQTLNQESVTVITDANGNYMYSLTFIVGFNE